MTVQHNVPVSPAVTAGIDWASSEHAVALVDEHGIQRQRRTVPHTKAGIGQLVAMLSRAGVTEVGIERGDGPLVEALIAARFTRLCDRPEPDPLAVRRPNPTSNRTRARSGSRKGVGAQPDAARHRRPYRGTMAVEVCRRREGRRDPTARTE